LKRLEEAALEREREKQSLRKHDLY